MGYFKRLMGSNQSREYATPLGSIMKDESNPGFSTLSDLEDVAAKKANKSAWAYIQGGAGEEWTLRVNREAFHRRTLRPRVLVNVLPPSTSPQPLAMDLSTLMPKRPRREQQATPALSQHSAPSPPFR